MLPSKNEIKDNVASLYIELQQQQKRRAKHHVDAISISIHAREARGNWTGNQLGLGWVRSVRAALEPPGEVDGGEGAGAATAEAGVDSHGRGVGTLAEAEEVEWTHPLVPRSGTQRAGWPKEKEGNIFKHHVVLLRIDHIHCGRLTSPKKVVLFIYLHPIYMLLYMPRVKNILRSLQLRRESRHSKHSFKVLLSTAIWLVYRICTSALAAVYTRLYLCICACISFSLRDSAPVCVSTSVDARIAYVICIASY